MTRLETDYMVALMDHAAEISKQLKIANRIKCLELKLAYPQDVNMIDNLADEIG